MRRVPVRVIAIGHELVIDIGVVLEIVLAIVIASVIALDVLRHVLFVCVGTVRPRASCLTSVIVYSIVTIMVIALVIVLAL